MNQLGGLGESEMRRLLIALAMLVATPIQAQAARGVDDPRAFVAATYQAYRANSNAPPADLSFVYSDRLQALHDAYDAWQAAHEDLVGSVGFDWWTNSQDWDTVRVDDLSVSRQGPARMTVAARFTIYDRSDTNRFLFVRQGSRWYLDDVINGSGSSGDGWTLSTLLQERQD